MILMISLGLLAGGSILIRRGYPLPGLITAGAGLWLGIVWTAFT